ncbi:MAG: Asp-tRNA(Asn)/Glu-tRNA(Gln) amidotransferase subunit GatA, partial [Solobacterium sp.]|nr:Asp-tRNA(Asn)/Glu-tRNA(Gln) amidotransferase subunit GatA [Solobacterium sp.]
MIKDMVNHPADSAARCEEAYAKAQELQEKLNAVITFVDPKEQISQLPEGGLLHGVP